MSGLLDQRADVFAFSSAGGMFPESRYTRVPNYRAPDFAWPTRMTPANSRERQVAAQSQSEVDVAFTFLDEILEAGGLGSDGAIRMPSGPGNPIYKIAGEPRQSRLTRRVIVLATRAGDDVIANLDEALGDPRAIVSESFAEFNVPAVVGAYAPEVMLIDAPPGSAWMRGRFTREAVLPAGASCEEWVLKAGGDRTNPAHYFPVFTLMTANFVSVAIGPRTAVEVRVKSGGTAGIVRVHATSAQLEPVIDEQTVTYHVSGVPGQYAPEHMTFRSVGDVIMGHLAVILESSLPAGTVLDSWVLRPDGDPENDDDYLPSGANFLVGAGLGGNPFMPARTVRLRAKSGATPGAFTMHGLCTARTGWA